MMRASRQRLMGVVSAPEVCNSPERCVEVIMSGGRALAADQRVASRALWALQHAEAKAPASLSASSSSSAAQRRRQNSPALHAVQSMQRHWRSVSASCSRLLVPVGEPNVFGAFDGFAEAFFANDAKLMLKQRPSKKQGSIDHEDEDVIAQSFMEFLENHRPTNTTGQGMGTDGEEMMPYVELLAIVEAWGRWVGGVSVGEPVLKVFPQNNPAAHIPTEAELQAYKALGHWLNDHRGQLAEDGAGGMRAVVTGAQSGLLAGVLLVSGAMRLLCCDRSDAALSDAEAVIQQLWRSRRVSHVDREVEVRVAELVPNLGRGEGPSGIKVGRWDDQAAPYNLVTFAAPLPPVLSTPVELARSQLGAGGAWHYGMRDVAQRFSSTMLTGRGVNSAAQLLDVPGTARQAVPFSMCAAIHTNHHDLIDGSASLAGDGRFAKNNPLRGLADPALHRPDRPRYDIITTRQFPLRGHRNQLVENLTSIEPMQSRHRPLGEHFPGFLAGVRDSTQRQAFETDVQRYADGITQELLLFRRFPAILKDTAQQQQQEEQRSSQRHATNKQQKHAPAYEADSVQWKDTYEYNNYLPKAGPSNPFDITEVVNNYGYLKDNSTGGGGGGEHARALAAVKAAGRNNLGSRLLEWEAPNQQGSSGTNTFAQMAALRSANDELRRTFASELEVSRKSRQGRTAKARERKLRKMVGQAKNTKEWWIDAKVVESTEAELKIINELERFEYCEPK